MLVCAGVSITLATGFVHGRLTQRWGAPPDLRHSATNLKELPAEIGDWRLQNEEPLTASVLKMLSCAGYVNRQYVNRNSGETISIAIIVGPPGPTSVHTPEICYSSRAYSIQESRRELSLSDDAGRTHSFWYVPFRSENPLADELRVYYAWCADDVWVASEAPRFEFAGRPLLFKLQIACSIPSQATRESQDPCTEFLTAFLRANWKSNG
jgi:hypothetical protein